MLEPKTLDHPTFGQCDLVPAIVAIQWKRSLNKQAITAALETYGAELASEVPKVNEVGGVRDPRAVNVNQSATLTWASAAKLTDATLTKIAADPNVAWVGPVYRAAKSEPGPQSYFTINPTVLILTKDAAAAAGDLTVIDDSISVDAARGKLLKGLVVLKLSKGNAIEVAEKLSERGVKGGVIFENGPYLSPLCGCCGTARSKKTHQAAGVECVPSSTPIIPNDPFFPLQWGLQRINAPTAWPLSEGDPNIVIAVLDQGVELGHPDLNMWPLSYSTITHTNDGSPVGPHGTACAGIIGSKINNGIGVSGLAGKCPVMAIATNFMDVEVAEGLYFAADNGARVVSMSFGVYPAWNYWNFAIIEAALLYCYQKNVVLVAATGNENQPVSRFPATDPHTIGVGGSNRADIRKAVGDTSIENWWGACYGPDLDVVAPCLEIPTTDQFGGAGYDATDYNMRFNGTSAATPHVAALAGLMHSVNPALTNVDVLQKIAQSADKINSGAYLYTPTAGKPYGTWNNDVGYGRINAERALLMACSCPCGGEGEEGPCSVTLPCPEECCVSPCDPPWLSDEQCMIWYEYRYFRAPLQNRDNEPRLMVINNVPMVEFRVTYQHKMCLLGKQHGPLLYTVTLLPKEKITLYHSDRYRRVTSETARFSMQTTFMQFLSVIHQAHVTGTFDQLSDKLTSVKADASGTASTGIAGVLFGGGSTSVAASTSTTDHTSLHTNLVSDQFHQSVIQSSQLTHAERSLVVSTYEEQETRDVSQRVIENANDCRAVTYFVRQVVELYAMSTIVTDVSYRILSQEVPPDWHTVNDLGWLPGPIQAQIKQQLVLLPRVGTIVEKPRPISLPTDGSVYDPELAHCCSCEPERAAALQIQLEKQKAEAIKMCLETQMMELEIQRRKRLLELGNLEPFDAFSSFAQVGTR